MKNRWLIVSTTLAVMALGMIMAACSSGTETPGVEVEKYSYTVGNVRYTLEITENRGALYTAKTNDFYKLFAVYGGTGAPVLVSEGYISNVASGATAKVQNYSLRDANGTNLIVQVVYATVTNASGAASEVPIVAQVVGILVPIPGSGGQSVNLAPGTPVTADLPTGSTITSQPDTPTLTSPTFNPASSGDGNNSGNNSGGTLRITNIPSQYNGKYIGVDAQKWEPEELKLFGVQSINTTTGAITLVPIANGQAVVPMWKLTFTDNTGATLQSVARYSGNDTFTYSIDNYTYLVAYIFPSATTSFYTDPEYTVLEAKAFQTVTFTNGNGTVSYGNGFDFVPEGWGEGPGTPHTPRPGAAINLPTGETLNYAYSDSEDFYYLTTDDDGYTFSIGVENYLLDNVSYETALAALKTLFGNNGMPALHQSLADDSPLYNLSSWVIFEIVRSSPSPYTVDYRLVTKTGQKNTSGEDIYKGTSWWITDPDAPTEITALTVSLADVAGGPPAITIGGASVEGLAASNFETGTKIPASAITWTEYNVNTTDSVYSHNPSSGLRNYQGYAATFTLTAAEGYTFPWSFRASGDGDSKWSVTIGTLTDGTVKFSGAVFAVNYDNDYGARGESGNRIKIIVNFGTADVDKASLPNITISGGDSGPPAITVTGTLSPIGGDTTYNNPFTITPSPIVWSPAVASGLDAAGAYTSTFTITPPNDHRFPYDFSTSLIISLDGTGLVLPSGLSSPVKAMNGLVSYYEPGVIELVEMPPNGAYIKVKLTIVVTE